jgi:hypothetical protein
METRKRDLPNDMPRLEAIGVKRAEMLETVLRAPPMVLPAGALL